MLAADGAFDNQKENVTSAIDISDLAAGNYTIAVRGLDAGGNWCSWSNITFTLTDNQGPSCGFKDSMPSSVGLSSSPQMVNLTISDEDFGATAISGIEWRILDRLTGTNGSVSEAVTAQDGVLNQASEDVFISLNFGDWEAGLYSMYVRGLDSAGNSGGWIVWEFDLYDDMAPATPTSLWVVNTTVHGELKLIWAANSEYDLAGYNIYRTTIPGQDYEFVASVGPDAITWSDSNLANDTVYFYVMTAFDGASIPNESPFSSEAGAKTIRAEEGTAHTDSIGPEIWAFALIAVIIVLIVIVLLLRYKQPRKEKPPGPLT